MENLKLFVNIGHTVVTCRGVFAPKKVKKENNKKKLKKKIIKKGGDGNPVLFLFMNKISTRSQGLGKGVVLILHLLLQNW